VERGGPRCNEELYDRVSIRLAHCRLCDVGHYRTSRGGKRRSLYATSDMYVRGKTYIHTYIYGERLDCRVGRPSRSSSASHGCTEMKDV
jgi:hypothetical protein